ncbi:MAG TPA: hypothetical protein VKV39_20480 [Candidatus Sulfotelmatobacter sp.]|nr:hypothetical protein [Candidatus Sulfotelmatobacter sp.]
MYSCDDPGQRVSIAQLNSELRHAHLELVSAHCATHQLRLRYSLDDLARLGRRDVLRKSAEAASALHEFYRSIDQRLAAEHDQPEPTPLPSEAQIAQAVRWLSGYLREQRDLYFPQASALPDPVRERLSPYFAATLLDRVRIIELRGKRVAVPGFFSEARALGYDNLPDVQHMESMTFIDVIAFNEALQERALFHALVHTVQIELLGLEGYAEFWVHSFLKTKAHFTVALEVHAFSLASRFLRPGVQKFSVEKEVLHWAAANRY